MVSTQIFNFGPISDSQGTCRWPRPPGSTYCGPHPNGRELGTWFLGSPNRCLTCPEGLFLCPFFRCWCHLGPPVLTFSYNKTKNFQTSNSSQSIQNQTLHGKVMLFGQPMTCSWPRNTKTDQNFMCNFDENETCQTTVPMR